MSEAWAQRIREVRHKTGLAQKDFAKQMGVAQVTMNRIENGHRQPDIVFLEQLREKFEVNLNWLIQGTEPQQVHDGGVPLLSSAPRDKQIPPTRLRVVVPGLPACDYALRVSEEAMRPMFHPGDLVLVSQAEPLRDDVVVLVDRDGLTRIRRMGAGNDRQVYVPENPGYPPIPAADVMALCGKVVGSLRMCSLA